MSEKRKEIEMSSKVHEVTSALDDLHAAQTEAIEADLRLVRDLGERIGYGNMMHRAERAWREMLAGRDYPTGGEFSVGPCAAELVQCPHPDAPGPVSCGWCCASGRVTKRVLEAIEFTARVRRLADGLHGSAVPTPDDNLPAYLEGAIAPLQAGR
jgi:hypothetical protein